MQFKFVILKFGNPILLKIKNLISEYMKTPILSLFAFCALAYGCNTHTSGTTTATDSLHNAHDTLATIENADQSTEQNQEIGEKLLKNESFGPIALGLSAAKTKEALGTPDETSKAEEWEADGETHQQWTYQQQGVILDMIGNEEQVINTISITSPCTLKTKRNIGIGSTVEDVKTAYDDVIDKSFIESEMIIAGTFYGGLIFKIENDKVTSISAGAVAE